MIECRQFPLPWWQGSHDRNSIICNAGRRRVAESKRFAWMIESAWSTHLAQKVRQRIVLYENTKISELTKHKALRNFGLLLKITNSGTWSFLHRRSHILNGQRCIKHIICISFTSLKSARFSPHSNELPWEASSASTCNNRYIVIFSYRLLCSTLMCMGSVGWGSTILHSTVLPNLLISIAAVS